MLGIMLWCKQNLLETKFSRYCSDFEADLSFPPDYIFHELIIIVEIRLEWIQVGFLSISSRASFLLHLI